ncbi:Uncharacterized protein TCM_035179 [Theobroma cacao]|uniref:Uncharacterized protein n=1 Tax=Theobroma cacao TaxID=3641 RepID=A0A061FI55_THECC|nr:Uncharacterized protein TCM_035179 [Theobroma cacao]
MPLNLYHKSVLRRIASLLGKLLKINYNTDSEKCGKFARIAVKLNLSKLLIPRFLLNGKMKTIEYEGLSKVCFLSSLYGHLKGECCGLPSNNPGSRFLVLEGLAVNETLVTKVTRMRKPSVRDACRETNHEGFANENSKEILVLQTSHDQSLTSFNDVEWPTLSLKKNGKEAMSAMDCAAECANMAVENLETISSPSIGARHGGITLHDKGENRLISDMKSNTVEYLNRISKNQSGGLSQKLESLDEHQMVQDNCLINFGRSHRIEATGFS